LNAVQRPLSAQARLLKNEEALRGLEISSLRLIIYDTFSILV
jgi:hypothetical protein